MHTQYAFVAGERGNWQVSSVTAVCGEPLRASPALDRRPAAEAPSALQAPVAWALYGVISNTRYATRSEVSTLRQRQEGLGRPAATRAALIPIKKSVAWWDLAQDERRAIFEETSHHTAIGLDYLPAVSRQLFHCRDIGEPFDFLTWFEYAPEDAAAFEHLVERLRATREWTYVEREVDVRLERA
jgi:chlorite dismutase